MACLDDPIRIGGSSTVFPMLSAAIQAYVRQAITRRLDLHETGTTDGFRCFCVGQPDIANDSRPINSKELKAYANNFWLI